MVNKIPDYHADAGKYGKMCLDNNLDVVTGYNPLDDVKFSDRGDRQANSPRPTPGMQRSNEIIR